MTPINNLMRELLAAGVDSASARATAGFIMQAVQTYIFLLQAPLRPVEQSAYGSVDAYIAAMNFNAWYMTTKVLPSWPETVQVTPSRVIVYQRNGEVYHVFSVITVPAAPPPPTVTPRPYKPPPPVPVDTSLSRKGAVMALSPNAVKLIGGLTAGGSIPQYNCVVIDTTSEALTTKNIPWIPRRVYGRGMPS